MVGIIIFDFFAPIRLFQFILHIGFFLQSPTSRKKFALYATIQHSIPPVLRRVDNASKSGPPAGAPEGASGATSVDNFRGGMRCKKLLDRRPSKLASNFFPPKSFFGSLNCNTHLKLYRPKNRWSGFCILLPPFPHICWFAWVPGIKPHQGSKILNAYHTNGNFLQHQRSQPIVLCFLSLTLFHSFLTLS